MHIIQAIFTLFCIAGSIFHMFSVVKIYVGKEVDRHVSIDIRKEVEVPLLSICFQMFDFKMFFEPPYNKNLKEDRKIFFQKMDGLLTLKQLYHILPKASDIIESYIVAPKSFSNGWFTPFISIKPYFFEPYYCHSIGAEGERIYYVNSLDNGISDFGNNHLVVKIKRDVLKYQTSMYVFIHQQKTHLHEHNVGIKKVYLKSNYTLVEFAYEKIIFKLLPYPYETMCQNYQELGFETRNHAIEHCVQEKFLATFNRSLPFSSRSVYTNIYLGYGFAMTLKQNLTNLLKLHEMRKQCFKQYEGPDCEQAHYLIRNYWISQVPNDAVVVKMKTVYGPNLKISTKQKISFGHCIIYLGSVLSIWYGFTITFDIPKAISFVGYKFFKTRSFGHNNLNSSSIKDPSLICCQARQRNNIIKS